MFSVKAVFVHYVQLANPQIHQLEGSTLGASVV
jgi:hypothetical protein